MYQKPSTVSEVLSNQKSLSVMGSDTLKTFHITSYGVSLEF